MAAQGESRNRKRLHGVIGEGSSFAAVALEVACDFAISHMN
jgi:hypothetical protein